MSLWTLSKNGGTPQTLAAWGFSKAQLTIKSQAIDLLTVRQGVPFDSDPVLAFGDSVVLAKDGARWFAGRVDDPELYGSSRSERITHAMVGPWWWLQSIIYQSTRQSWNGAEAVPVYSDNVFLGQNPVDGSHWTTGQQIQAALDWAIALGAPIQYDTTNFPALTSPFIQVRSVYCSEVIRQMLRFSPDTTTWWDYSTTPPTFRCVRRANQGSITLPVSAGNEQTFKPRYSLVLPSVAITYESSTYVQGVKYVSTVQDIAPIGATGREPRALAVSIDLEGGNFSYATAKIRVAQINNTSMDLTARMEWWGRKFPWLNSPEIDPATIVISPDNNASFPTLTGGPGGELVDGQIAPWMVDGSNNPIKWADDTLTATVTYKKWKPDGHGPTVNHGDELSAPLAVRIRSTNAVTGTYSALQNELVGEAMPIGLAAQVYAAVSVLQYQGDLTLPGAECTPVGMGNLLNVSGGRAEWTTMAALIVGVDYDIDEGSTKVHVGPHDHLSPDQLMELVRATRLRFNWTNPATTTTGVNSTGGQVDLGDAVPRENSTSEGGNHSRKFISVPDPTDGTGTKMIDLDLNPIGHQTDGVQPVDLGVLGTGQFLNVGPKVLRVCSTNPTTGVTIHRWIISYASDMFTLPGDPIDS
jgi:hypothetical protein